jgi:hypothetical protein
VSVARYQGVVWIEAEVTEFYTRLSADSGNGDVRALGAWSVRRSSGNGVDDEGGRFGIDVSLSRTASGVPIEEVISCKRFSYRRWYRPRRRSSSLLRCWVGSGCTSTEAWGTRRRRPW